MPGALNVKNLRAIPRDNSVLSHFRPSHTEASFDGSPSGICSQAPKDKSRLIYGTKELLRAPATLRQPLLKFGMAASVSDSEFLKLTVESGFNVGINGMEAPLPTDKSFLPILLSTRRSGVHLMTAISRGLEEMPYSYCETACRRLPAGRVSQCMPP